MFAWPCPQSARSHLWQAATGDAIFCLDRLLLPTRASENRVIIPVLAWGQTPCGKYVTDTAANGLDFLTWQQHFTADRMVEATLAVYQEALGSTLRETLFT